MKKNYTSLTIAILGIILGALLTLTVQKAVYSKKYQFDGDYDRWRKLNLILQEIERNYVDTIDMKKMTDAAVEAALAELDPHSIYLPPVQLENSEVELAGNFEGIGIQFNVPNDTAVVLSAIPGGPSEKAGIQTGDKIIRVDENVIAGTKTHLDSMVRYMKGPAGTKVKIVVSRDGEIIPFDITRDKIPVNSIDAAFMVDDRTAYVRLAKFSMTTYKEFAEASTRLLSEGMKRMIFDLRDNTGGYLEQASLLVNEFLDDDAEIVYFEGLHRPRRDFKANGKGKLKDVEISVLINDGSASSSEIFAGAIQDNDRGIIVGRRSFGKGLVQEPVNFTDNSGIRLTVARYYTPSGRCIQKPYSKDYQYDVYERYMHGEMTNADSMKVDQSKKFYTMGRRVVYGGGGIIPDIFVPMDTTKATPFHISCNKKATTMRFASAMFDRYKSVIAPISDFAALEKAVKAMPLESEFLSFAKTRDGLVPGPGEWEESRKWLMPQIYGLVGRFSKMGETAYYKFSLEIDDVYRTAYEAPSIVQ
ncbi:MAG: S41 family peptidase [Bacteroidales bacterium]|nr:S41 family peptidase [Bacteroidales bacterium]